MPAGDILTQTGTPPPLAWSDPATVIAANGRVLATVTSGGGKVPQWMDAADAVSGGNNVLTMFFDTGLSHNRPAWLPLAATPSPVQVWVINAGDDSISRFTPSGGIFGAPLTGLSSVGVNGANGMGLVTATEEVWIANYNDTTVARLKFDGTESAVPLTSGDFTASLAGIAVVDAQVWIANGGFFPSSSIVRLNPDGTRAGAPLTDTYLTAAYYPAVVGSEVWVCNQFADPAIIRFALDGTSAGPRFMSADLDSPAALVVVGDEAWIVNLGSNSIARLHFDGTSAGANLTGNGLNAPAGIRVVGLQVWVTNSNGDSISLFNFDGTSAGSPLTGNGLNVPLDVLTLFA